MYPNFSASNGTPANTTGEVGTPAKKSGSGTRLLTVIGPSTVTSPTSPVVGVTAVKAGSIGASVTVGVVSGVEVTTESVVEESLFESLLEQLTKPTVKIGTINKARIFTMIPRSTESELDNRPTWPAGLLLRSTVRS
ncbi:unannotated protein [freshwater metagenome]|uniref:Unannotated protein n=1 Tax=freshwater metagenome TaxID=449393 RepID=A0A6J7S9V4_9ZZZZ